MSVFRLLALAILLYITADFVDPMIPGVFSFDADQFFVDSVVQLTPDAVGEALPELGPSASESSTRRASDQGPPIAWSRAARVRHAPRSHLAHARAPSPPSRSEDH
jgi:hypothetical protein